MRLRQGSSVGAHPKIVLGQQQYSYGGKLGKSQSVVGEIGDGYMWDSVLPPEEIWFVYQGIYIKPNILDWWALNYTMQAYVAPSPINRVEVLQQDKVTGKEIRNMKDQL